MKEKSKIKTLLIIIIVIAIIVAMVLLYFRIKESKITIVEDGKQLNSEENGNNETRNSNILTNGISKFDLKFLQLENNKKNEIYSPLSIKYALKNNYNAEIVFDSFNQS